MLLRSLGVITFIAIAGAAGIYFAQRPTIAKGDVIAADLVQSNPSVESMTCDQEIPIGHEGATFFCGVVFKDGTAARLKFVYDRNGAITQVPHDGPAEVPAVKKTADPWGD